VEAVVHPPISLRYKTLTLFICLLNAHRIEEPLARRADFDERFSPVVVRIYSIAPVDANAKPM